jgi:hypothetical protein
MGVFNKCVVCSTAVVLAIHLFLGMDVVRAAREVVKISNEEVLALPRVKGLLKLSKYGAQPTKPDIEELIAGPVMENILQVAYAKIKKLDKNERYEKSLVHCKPGDKKLPFEVPCEEAWFTLSVLAHSVGVGNEIRKTLESLSEDELKKMYDAAPKGPHEATLIELSGLRRRQEAVVRDVLSEQLEQKVLREAQAAYDIQFEPGLSTVLFEAVSGRKSKQEQRWLADKKRMEELDKE